MIAAARFPLRSDPATTSWSAQVPTVGSGSRLDYCRLAQPIIQVARQLYPAFKAVIQGFSRR